MQQTALNLVAIAIFLMTMSALLTPVLPIPPAAPAATVLGVLSLFTIDTLAWQGRGTTLLLDTLAPKTHRERVIRHEAGHFLAAYLSEIPVTGYTLSAWEAWRENQPGLGGVRFDTEALERATGSASTIGAILDRFGTVWMAGMAAEAIACGTASGGRDDRDKLRLALAHAGYSPQECLQKERLAQRRAQSLLEENSAAYAALVEAMEKRSPVADCYQLLARYFPD